MRLKSTPNLVNERVFLEELTYKHISSRYISWLNDPVVRQFTHLRFQDFQSEHSIKDYIDKHSSNVNSRVWAILKLPNKDHIGTVTLWIDFKLRNGTLGILVDPSQQNSTFSTSAVGLVLEYAFLDLSLNRINGGAVAGNLASILLHKKLFFEFEGVKRQSEPVNNTSEEFYDFLSYSLLKSDWLKRRPESREKLEFNE